MNINNIDNFDINNNIKFLTATQMIINVAEFLEKKYPKLSLALLDISKYLVDDNRITEDQISSYNEIKSSIKNSLSSNECLSLNESLSSNE